MQHCFEIALWGSLRLITSRTWLGVELPSSDPVAGCGQCRLDTSWPISRQAGSFDDEDRIIVHVLVECRGVDNMNERGQDCDRHRAYLWLGEDRAAVASLSCVHCSFLNERYRNS